MVDNWIFRWLFQHPVPAVPHPGSQGREAGGCGPALHPAARGRHCARPSATRRPWPGRLVQVQVSCTELGSRQRQRDSVIELLGQEQNRKSIATTNLTIMPTTLWPENMVTLSRQYNAQLCICRHVFAVAWAQYILDDGQWVVGQVTSNSVLNFLATLSLKSFFYHVGLYPFIIKDLKK